MKTRSSNPHGDVARILGARHTTLPLLAVLALHGVAGAEALRDPTRPANARAVAQTPASGATQLRVEAIFSSGGRHLAIVNGKVVRGGDRVAGCVIEEVLPNGIRYTRAGESHAARLEDRSLNVRRNVSEQETGT